jgi:hypothetical protein
MSLHDKGLSGQAPFSPISDRGYGLPFDRELLCRCSAGQFRTTGLDTNAIGERAATRLARIPDGNLLHQPGIQKERS